MKRRLCGAARSTIVQWPSNSVIPSAPGSDNSADEVWPSWRSRSRPHACDPNGIRNSVPVAGATGVPIQQAFIGCCANGTLGDLAEAARVVKGRKIGSLPGGSRFLVTPATQEVFNAVLRWGYVANLMEAGAVVTADTYGACFARHARPRRDLHHRQHHNFKGRMAGARIYLASPEPPGCALGCAISALRHSSPSRSTDSSSATL
jgi:3-isopropylmalate/(R)-2-methylmalate dehydratase large subunit